MKVEKEKRGGEERDEGTEIELVSRMEKGERSVRRCTRKKGGERIVKKRAAKVTREKRGNKVGRKK